jgi:hypothetical protein
MSLPERINFAQEEEKILQLWERLNAFQRSLDLSRGKPEVRFNSLSLLVTFCSISHQDHPFRCAAVHVLRWTPVCDWVAALRPHPGW